jgi:hypothetical protein
VRRGFGRNRKVTVITVTPPSTSNMATVITKSNDEAEKMILQLET